MNTARSSTGPHSPRRPGTVDDLESRGGGPRHRSGSPQAAPT
ncbi:hypothetical protein [Streptomyces cinereospinus]|uniref:Uncharacterized protein n=1 Tax=Streptomyces cinereospinus TaxID=285561 RepID=A0ABV5N0I2_9ACTN